MLFPISLIPMFLQDCQQELQYLHQEWKSESAKDFGCLGLGDLERSLLAATSPFGTEAAVFKTEAEVLLPIELEEGVVD